MSTSITQNLAAGAETIPIDIVAESITKTLINYIPAVEIRLIITIRVLILIIAIRSLRMYFIYSNTTITDQDGNPSITSAQAIELKVLFMIGLCVVFVIIRLVMSSVTNIVFSSDLDLHYYIGFAAFVFCSFIPMISKFVNPQ